MVAPLLLAALLAFPPPASPDSPRDVVRQATQAVQGDSAAVVRTRWLARLARDPADDAALLGLATLADKADDRAAAEELYRRLTGAAARGEFGFAAHAHLGQAGLLVRRGQVAAAEQGYLQARRYFRRAEDPVGEAEALRGLAGVRQRTRGSNAALEVLDEAMRLPLDGAPGTSVAIRCERANLRGHVGHPDALAEAEHGYRLAQRTADKASQLLCLRAMLQRLSKESITDTLRRVVDRMEVLSRETNERVTLISALTWRAMFLRSTWQLDAARAALLEAVRIGEQIGHDPGIAWALLELGGIYGEAGDHASAASHLSHAVQRFEKYGEQSGLADARLIEANSAMRAGQLTRAGSLFLHVLQWGEESGTTHLRIGGRYGVAATAARLNDLLTAGAHLDTLEQMVREQRIGGTEPVLAFARGMLALRRNDLEEAERAFRHAIHRSETNAPLHQLEASARLAQVLALRGEVGAAEAELHRMSDQFDASRASLEERELRLLAFQRHDIFGDASAGWASTLAALVRAGRIDAAFELAERRRARELFDRLTRARALQPSARGVRAVHFSAPENRPSSAQLRASLPDERTALLEYVTGSAGEPTVLFVVTRERLTAHRLPPVDSLTGVLGRFVHLIENGQEARHAGRRLGAMLLDSATRALPREVTRLVIVPDGMLHRVPFDALILDDDRYVLERFAVTLAPSARVAVELWRRPLDTREPAILAFGDPQFADETEPAGPQAEVYRSAFAADGGLPRLAASGREAKRVARYAKRGVVRLRDRASVAYLKQAPLDEFRVVHFATHARVDEAAITRTALALAPGAEDDGFVGATDLMELTLNADLVVLSACRTAGGVVLTGEGIQGLSAPLLAAGARSVAATLWPIGDRQTLRLVDDFYRALADGLPAGDALHAAKLRALRRGAPPAEWASFTLVGDPHVRVPLRHPGHPWQVWAGGLAAAFLAAAYGARRWKAARPERR